MHLSYPVIYYNLLLTVPRLYICYGSRLPVVGVRDSVTFYIMFGHIIYSSV